MRFYYTSGTRKIDGNTHTSGVWSGSQASAATDRKTFRAEGTKDADTVEVDVPTSKDGLLKFLNLSGAKAPK